MTLQELQPFCSIDPARPKLHAPFTIGDWSYATDGKICIRVPNIPGCAGIGPENAPTLFAEINHTNMRLAEWPPDWNRATPIDVICEECFGSGRLLDCESCGASGSKECKECGHNEECRDCGGVGLIACNADEGQTCIYCGGIGKRFAKTPVALSNGAVVADLRYLLLIAGLPEARLKHAGGRDTMFFEFKGGEGLLMPVCMP